MPRLRRKYNDEIKKWDFIGLKNNESEYNPLGEFNSYKSLKELMDEWEDAPEDCELEIGEEVYIPLFETPRVMKINYLTMIATAVVNEENKSIIERAVELGSAFSNWEDAQEHKDWMKAFTALRRDMKGYKHKRGEIFYVVVYDSCKDNDFFVAERRDDRSEPIYFKTKEDAKESLKNHREEWKTFLNTTEGED